MKKQILSGVYMVFLAVGAATAQVGIHIRVAPPPPHREVPPPPPHPGWVWQSGYHRWDGRSYV